MLVKEAVNSVSWLSRCPIPLLVLHVHIEIDEGIVLG